MNTTAAQLYYNCIRKTLEAALCPYQVMESQHNKPEVEYGTNKELLFNPIVITNVRSKSNIPPDRCMIEGSVNSVRISLAFKKYDQVELVIYRRFMNFLMNRAEQFLIMRRKPIDRSYDISFLITNFHMENMLKEKLIDFIIGFIEEIHNFIQNMKLHANVHACIVAHTYKNAFR